MDSTAVESISINNNNNKLDKVDDSYEDDFEKDLESEENSQQVSSPRKTSASDDDQDVITSPPKRAESPTEKEKGQREIESPGRERSLDEPSDNDSEPDADAYNFTEDQKRAMMELMVQKQEDSDLLDEEPPEYNVKGRLEQLNAELANEPTPQEGDREHRVGFKAEIVDLVAPPPPDYSDDDSQPNSARGEREPQPNAAKTPSSSSQDHNENKDDAEDPNKKQFVVERDGNFSVLSGNELTASERAMLMQEEPVKKKSDKQSENQVTKDKSQSHTGSAHSERNKSNNNSQVVPKPPSRPRPNTASTGPRRNVRPAQSPRPKSAGYSSNSSTTLEDFNYNSPYAMTPEEKEQAREEARRREEEKRENERKKQDEEEKRRRDNDSAFEAWLHSKKLQSSNRRDDEGREQSEQQRERHYSKNNKHRVDRKTYKHSQKKKVMMNNSTESVSSPDDSFESYEVIYPYLLGKSLKVPKEENEEAYRTWLKEKRSQGKKDKLLKRRQQQEQMEGYFMRSREDCDKAFKEWLKKKNAEFKRQQSMERQKNRMYRLQVKRSKKTQALVRALKESQAFRYVDYYGYRY